MSRKSKAAEPLPIGVKGAALVLLAAIIGGGLWYAQNAHAEEAIATEEPALVEVVEDPAVEEQPEPERPGWRDRLSSMMSYVIDGDTSEILDSKAVELAEREEAVSARESALIAQIEEIEALRDETTLEAGEVANVRQQVLQRAADLSQCAAQALGGL